MIKLNNLLLAAYQICPGMDIYQHANYKLKICKDIYIMEEIGLNNNNNAQLQHRKVSVKASEIINKFKSIRDRQSFCKEMSKIQIYNIFRFVLSERNRIRLDFFSPSPKRRKKSKS